MKHRIILVLSLCPVLLFGQNWVYPDFVYPMDVIGMNNESIELKGIKTKDIVYCFGCYKNDTLFGHYEYDKKGRLIKKLDQYWSDSVYYDYERSNEWVIIRSMRGDTIAKKTIEFGVNKKPMKVVVEKPNGIYSYEVKKINDTLSKMYYFDYLWREIIHDKNEQIKYFFDYSSNLKIEIKHSSDTTFWIKSYVDGDTLATGFMLFENGKIVLEEELMSSNDHIRYKTEYDQEGKITATYYSLKSNGDFVYTLDTKYEYNKKKQLVKETRYNSWGAMRMELKYSYY